MIERKHFITKIKGNLIKVRWDFIDSSITTIAITSISIDSICGYRLKYKAAPSRADSRERHKERG